MAKTDITTIAFLRIDLGINLTEVELRDPQKVIKVHSAIGALYPSTSPWSDYEGLGGILTLGEVGNSGDVAASEFQVKLTLPDTEDRRLQLANIFAEVREDDALQDHPALLYILESESGAAPSLAAEPQLALVGRINTFEIDSRGIEARIYTPSTLLDRVIGVAPRYADQSHRRFTDPNDRSMRFLSDTSLAQTTFP